MTTKKPWSNDERESLYNAALGRIHEIFGEGEFSVNDPVIKSILEDHDGEREPSSIFHKLHEMGFIKIFYPNGNRVSLTMRDLHSYVANPAYKSFNAEQNKVAQGVLDSQWSHKTSEREMVACLADALKISETHAHCWLFQKGVVILKNQDMGEDDTPEYVMAVNPAERHVSPIIRLKKISAEEKRTINVYRSRLAGLYNSYEQPNPALVLSNDGTGTGKSYSVLDQFVDKTNSDGSGSGHRNFVFITPQKSQISFDPDTVTRARAKGIKFLGLYSKEDACKLTFKHWVDKFTTESLFKGWIKGLTGDHRYGDEISSFESYIGLLKQNEFRLERAEKEKDKQAIDRIAADINEIKDKMRGLMKDMAKKAMNDPKVPRDQGAVYYFTSQNKKDALLASILDHVTPLERAKHEPCVLMGTTDKFIHTTPVFRQTKEGYVIDNVHFDYALGHKLKQNTEEGVRDANGKSFEEQVRFIREEFFKIDEDNYYRKNNIDFTVVIDEEHIAHDKILGARHKVLFDHKIKVPHVLSAVYRIINRVKHSESSEGHPMVLQQAYKDFYDDVVGLFEGRCQSKFKAEQLLAMFQANLGDMTIDARDVEQVIGLCKNVFSVTPKRFFNENELKKIRFKSLGNDAECRIYFSNTKEDDESDQNPTMHDLVQITLCVFAACAKLKDDKISRWFSHNSVNNQNSLLTQFIRIARANRSCIESLFCRVDDQNINIDEFFAYFTPKIVFSIEKISDLPLSPADLESAIHVGLKAELFEELPEVSLMRILHDTSNTVMCLSATSGFHGSYSGNYARDIMRKFGLSESNPNLGFQTVTRTTSDVSLLQTLRDARKALRNVSFSSFRDRAQARISSQVRGPSFDETLRMWTTPLLAAMPAQNKYRVMETRRNVEALLMAAYDNKNTLALSLTNGFSRTVREYLAKNSNALGRPTYPIDGCDKVIDMTPFNNGVTIRVILFDADLNKQITLEDHVHVDKNTKIAFFSSFKTAGTGLNLLTKDKDEDGLEQDFERLVLVNSPWWSTVKSPEGINTAMNYILALKHCASNGGMTLEAFDKMLKTPAFKRTMMAEHRLSILKEIMQGIGRGERRDTHIDTEIYLPDTLLEDISLEFSHVNTAENNMLINSMSMLNKSLMDFCLEQMHLRSFSADSERESFMQRMAEDGNEIEHLFGVFLRKKILKKARDGDIQFAELNELFRTMDCVKNPERFMSLIQNHPLIKADPMMGEIVGKLYIKMPPEHEHIKLCFTKGVHPGLTDFREGGSVYRPYDMVVPEYTKTASKRDNDSARALRDMWDVGGEDSASPLPHPAMLALIKGNVGENLFKTFLSDLKVNPMSLKWIFEDFSPRAYELYDCYILKGAQLLCVDVKNWGSHIENGDLPAELVRKAENKRKTLTQICATRGLDASFVYVNTHYDRNAYNTMQEFTKGQPIHYMNLFKVDSFYENSKKYRAVSDAAEAMEYNESLKLLITR